MCVECRPFRDWAFWGQFTGPFGDTLLGPFGTVYWALWGQFFNFGTTGGPFGDTLLGLFGTLLTVPKGPT